MDIPNYQKLHFRTPQAAEYLGLSRSNLEKMRFRDDGPPYAKLGRLVIYDVSDLDAWVNARKRIPPTVSLIGEQTRARVRIFRRAGGQ